MARIPVFVLPKIPEDASDSLMEWFSESYQVFSELKEILQASFLERRQRLHEMPKKAGSLLWWPFTQHSLVREQSITLIDSRYGENFAVHKVCMAIFRPRIPCY
jgi:dethiobiotin synthetase/adenosylmethionine--8-amino-7-oxononanoate aminotransferase